MPIATLAKRVAYTEERLDDLHLGARQPTRHLGQLMGTKLGVVGLHAVVTNPVSIHI